MKLNKRNIIMTIIASFIMAFTVSLFYLNSGLVMGGTTGLAVLIQNLTGVSASLLVLLFNIILLVVGGIIVGKEFTANTILGSLLYPVFLAMMQKVLPGIPLSFFSVLSGSMLMGFSCYMLVSANASSGGTDALGVILNKVTSWDVVKIMSIFDGCVMLLLFAGNSWNIIVYSVFALCIQMSTLKIALAISNTEEEKRSFKRLAVITHWLIHLDDK